MKVLGRTLITDTDRITESENKVTLTDTDKTYEQVHCYTSAVT
jgi:hypothetical protein